MKKCLLSTIAILAVSIIFAQVPQGFNYQAVARDSDGNALASSSFTVRVGVLNSSSLVWQEDHAVVSSDMGLFSIVIGDESADKSGGSASAFSDINWGTGDFSLKISIDAGDGFNSMGVSPLMSVPYAMYAQNAPGGSAGSWSENNDTIYTNSSVGIGTSEPNQSLLAIQSTNPQVEKPLFEVRNDIGNPVFAVFNDGVMVYVDEDKTGTKGGFAVGGYNTANLGVTQEYFRITPDSVRIWVPEDTPTKGVKGGFAVGGYNKTSKATTNNFLEISSANTSIFFDTTTQAKGFKGGFAVGGYNKSKGGESNQLMSLTSSNYLIGQEAGLNISTGRNNTFFGWKSGLNNTEGSNNIMIGYNTGYSNSIGENNVFIGNDAGYSNYEGVNNIMIGYEAGFSNYGQGDDTFDGNYNVFLGHKSGYYNTSGGANVFLGWYAGWESDTGNYQTAIGFAAGQHAKGKHNTFIGADAGRWIDSSLCNTYLGAFAGNDGGGEYNTYLGYAAGYLGKGNSNVLLGAFSGEGNEDSKYYYNTYVGYASGFSTTTGSNNAYLGYRAGYLNATGSGNVFIGNYAGYYEGESDKLYIANSSTSSPLIYGDFNSSEFVVNGNAGINSMGYEGYGLFVDVPAGQTEEFALYSWGDVYAEGDYYSPAGVVYSLGKSTVSPVENALSKLNQVNGIYYEEQTKSGISKQSIGLVAEEIEKVFPELVKKNMEGATSVNYNGLIPVLIEAIKAQQGQLEAQQAEIDALKELISGK